MYQNNSLFDRKEYQNASIHDKKTFIIEFIKTNGTQRPTNSICKHFYGPKGKTEDIISILQQMENENLLSSKPDHEGSKTIRWYIIESPDKNKN